MEGSSPQKNFQLDLRNIRNLINNLQAELTTELAIDALRIAKNKDENEIMKLLDVIAKVFQGLIALVPRRDRKRARYLARPSAGNHTLSRGKLPHPPGTAAS